MIITPLGTHLTHLSNNAHSHKHWRVWLGKKLKDVAESGSWEYKIDIADLRAICEENWVEVKDVKQWADANNVKYHDIQNAYMVQFYWG